jgi:endoplasmic reticulum junction formation protein lunapark
MFQSDSTSPASFEKALSKLSQQITAANLSLDVTRNRGRRAKALWTLYTTLSYTLFLIVIFLVIGPHNWSLPHYAGVVGLPLLIYGVRQILAFFFDWRTNKQQTYLTELQKQRESKIADLKKATKYDSTQELLQKYGGAPPKSREPKDPQQGTKRKIVNQQNPPQRTGLPPPPTANIQRRNVGPQITPQRPDLRPQPDTLSPISPQALSQSPGPFSPDEPGFAPNAFHAPPPTAPPAYESGGNWYDRILDVMLGEDEAAAKNRIALLCSNCRLVNGQAPPGIKTLEELGKWRCGSCGAWNGVESETDKAVKQAVQQAKIDPGEGWEKVPQSDEEEDQDQDEASSPEPSSIMMESPTQDATGRESSNSGKATRRVTRSAQSEEPLEALE